MHTDPREAARGAAQVVAAKRLTWGSAGNISTRLSPDTFLISGSGIALADLTPDDFVLCSLDGTHRAAKRRPSLETPLHAATYRVRPDVGAVLHASPLHATLAASSDLELNPNLIVDSAYYVRAVRRVPYHPPGSTELAAAVTDVVPGADVLLLDNHGALTVGGSLADAVTRMEALELLAHLHVLAAPRITLRPLSPKQVHTMLHALRAGSTV